MSFRQDLRFHFPQAEKTLLCLACSSSLPPGALSKGEIFLTQCCTRPICVGCTTSNQRLVRYNPCLACLGGLAGGGSTSSSTSRTSASVQSRAPVPPSQETNIDGAIRDTDNFEIGEDSDDESSTQDDAQSLAPSYKSGPQSSMSGPSTASSLSVSSLSASNDSYAHQPEDISQDADDQAQHRDAIVEAPPATPAAPSKYYLKKGDTLQGLSLRFGVSGRELCQLNKLPPSTLSTTPHLLHTRGSILLPPSAKVKATDVTTVTISAEEEAEREAQRVRERAEKKLQTLTKEVDWRVAKVYVALAETATPYHMDQHDLKRKELGSGNLDRDGTGKGKGKLESMAVDAYLDDDEWEARNPFQSGSTSSGAPSSTRAGNLKQWLGKW